MHFAYVFDKEVIKMKKILGYVIAFVGLIILALGLELFSFGGDFLNNFSKWYVQILGGILIAIGVALSLMGKKGSRKSKDSDEVPIYEGTGKKRKIVGYRKD